MNAKQRRNIVRSIYTEFRTMAEDDKEKSLAEMVGRLQRYESEIARLRQELLKRAIRGEGK